MHRVGVASFISQLVQKVGDSIKPFTSTLLRLLFLVVEEERSGASKRAFANSCAFVLKYAAPSQVHKLIEETAALHSGDRNSQIACALLLKSYASTASDILSGYYATVVPVILLSRLASETYTSLSMGKKRSCKLRQPTCRLGKELVLLITMPYFNLLNQWQCSKRLSHT